jgi:hypothetical protein
MTEAVNPTYESLRDGVEDPAVRAAWRSGDRWAEHVAERYRAIAADEALSDEGRRLREEEAYERHPPR